MAVNYMDFLRNMGMGSRGASGFYSNMNRSMPGFGNVMQQGQKAGSAKFAASGLNALSQGNTKEAVKSGIGYALNQNPYIAGINMFNDITGGIRFDKMLGMGPKQPSYADKTGQRKTELDYQQAMSDDRNRYLQESARYNDEAARARGYVDDQRAILRDMQERGPSARSLAPMLGQFANINESAAGAARSNTAANLSRRGISSDSGLGIGAQTAVDTALNAQTGQQRAGVMNQVMQDTAQLRNAMLGVDAAAADKAAGRGIDLMDSAAMLPIRQAMLAQEEQKQQQARDQQMYMRRQGETEALGGFVGKMFPYIYDEYRRGVNRNDGTGDTTQRMDIGLPGSTGERFNTGTGAGGDFYFEQGGRQVFRDPFSGKLYDALTSEEVPEDLPMGTNLPLTIDQTPETGYFLPGGGYRSQDYAQNYDQGVEFQTGFALDQLNPRATIGSVAQYKGQFFMKMPNGWMKQ